MRTLIFISFFLLTINLFAQDYYPMVIGNSWGYNYYDSNGLLNGTSTSVIIESIRLNNQNGFWGQDNFILNSGPIPSDLYVYTDSLHTNDIYIYMANNWVKSRQHHYTDGDKWKFYGDSARVEYVGKVTVPAGIFDSCYYVKATSTTGSIYAPNVGLIKSINNNKISLLLTDYHVTLSNVSGLNEISSNNIQVYPNPSSDYISIPTIENINRLEIFDINGKTHLTSEFRSGRNNSIDISKYPSGIYFGKILRSDNSNVTFKFIKQ